MFTNYNSKSSYLQDDKDYDKSCNTLIDVINRIRISPGEYHNGAYHLTINHDNSVDLLATDYPRPSRVIFTAITVRDMFYFLTGILLQLSR